MTYTRPQSAEYWHKGADNQELSLAERLCCSQNAFNHIENAYAAEVEKNAKLLEALELISGQLGYAYTMQAQGSPCAAQDHRNLAYVKSREALGKPVPNMFGGLHDEFRDLVSEMLKNEDHIVILKRLNNIIAPPQ